MCRILFLLLLVASGINLGAQDLNFSQFYEVPLMRNPALAGIFDCNFRVKSIYRNQWQSVTTPYQTSGISAEMKFPAGKNSWHNVGLQVLYDVAGDSRLKRVELLPAYTFHLEIAEENYLSVGFMAGPVNTQFDPRKLSWNDQFVNGQYSPTNPTSQLFRNTTRNYFDLATGIVFTRPLGELGNLYFGGSMYHINKPVVSFDVTNDNRLDQRFGLNAGLTVPSGASNAFTMYADGFTQGGHRQAMIGGFYTFAFTNTYYDEQEKPGLHLGGVYRWNDAFIPVVKLDFNKVSLGLSYDVNVSKLKTASQSRGGFELTISYRNCRIGADRTSGLPCPRFGRQF